LSIVWLSRSFGDSEEVGLGRMRAPRCRRTRDVSVMVLTRGDVFVTESHA